MHASRDIGGNHDADVDVSASGLRIPRIIHQTWRDSNVAAHSHVAELSQRSWRSHHPDWDYRLWTDTELEPFIERYYSWFLPTWRQLNLKIKRIDAVRYCWLHHFGGMYADLDFVCIRNVEALLEGNKVVSYRSREAEKKNWRFAGNAWMASVPQHPLWISMLHHIRDYPGQEGTDMFSVLRHTGPMGLGKVIDDFLGAHGASGIRIVGSTLVGNESEPPYEFAYHARTQQWGQDWQAAARTKTRRLAARVVNQLKGLLPLKRR